MPGFAVPNPDEETRFDPLKRNGNTGVLGPGAPSASFPATQRSPMAPELGAGDGPQYPQQMDHRGDPLGFPQQIGQRGTPGFPQQIGQRNDPVSPVQFGTGTAGTAPQAPAGFGQGAAAPDPGAPQMASSAAGSYDRNGFRDAWMASGGKTPQDLANFVAAHQGDFGAGVQILPGGKGDKIRLPDGTLIDAVIGAGLGGTGAGWTGDPSQMGPAGMGGSAAGAGAGGAGGGLDGAFRDALLKAMQGANSPYDPNDPRNAAQQNAYNRQRDQAAQRQRGAMAERAAANGLNSGGAGSGGFDTGLQGILESAGQDEAGFGAGLAQQDYQAKRQDLAHALDLANAVGARQEASALQMQLAQLDNQYRYAALGQQQGQFEDNLGFDYTKWMADQNRLSLLAGMGG